jgi:hypothetical protein
MTGKVVACDAAAVDQRELVAPRYLQVVAKVSKSQAGRLFDGSHFPVIHIGRSVRAKRVDVERYLDSLGSTPEKGAE